MHTGGGIDELTGNSNTVTGLAYAAFQYIAYAKFASDLFYVNCTILVDEAGIAGDHEQPVHPRQGGYDLFHDTIGEIFLLRVAAEVLKRQDRNGGLRRQQWRLHRLRERSITGRFMRHRPVLPDRLVKLYRRGFRFHGKLAVQPVAQALITFQ